MEMRQMKSHGTNEKYQMQIINKPSPWKSITEMIHSNCNIAIEDKEYSISVVTIKSF